MNDNITGILEFSVPKKQNYWRWPAVINFILGGAGSGLYIISSLMSLFGENFTLTIKVELLAPVLIMFGMAVLVIEVGYPQNGYLVIRNIKKSWISREVLFSMFFIIAIAFEILTDSWVLRLTALVVAFLFMVSQGFILYSSRAVSAWNNPVIILFFISSGMVSGCAIALLTGLLGWMRIGNNFLLLVILCVLFNLLIWLYFLKFATKLIDSRLLSKTIKNPFMIFLIVGLGSLLPVFILLASIKTTSSELFSINVFTAAFSILLGIIIQKATLLHSIGFIRNIQMRLT